jgi:hypothetical protein
MPQDPLIGHLHATIAQHEDMLRRTLAELTRHRDFAAAVKASVKHSDGPVSPAFLRSTLDAYGLNE